MTTNCQQFASGHRSCRGCTAVPQPIRYTLSAMEEEGIPVVIANATGCTEVTSTLTPYTCWNVPYIHSVFANVAATASGIEAAYKVLEKKGKLKELNGGKEVTKPAIIALAGDGGSYDIGLQSLSGAFERGHDFVYICYDNEAYMNCLSTDSLIMTATGLKKITEVKRGEKVYAFEQKKYQLVLKKCTGVFDNGVKQVYKLQTLHHDIKATTNHPFLVLQRGGRGGKNKFTWKVLGKIKSGDEIVVSKKLNEGESFKFNFKKTKVGDYKVSHLNKVKLPKSSSSDLMKYLGLYVGDGWIREKKGEVGFALPAGTSGRKALLVLHRKIFRSKMKTDELYIYIHSVNLAKFIKSLGFGQGAKNKLVPSWVFTLPRKEKEAFLEGLMLSDGYKHGNSWRYVSASEELLRTLRLLLQTFDYRVGDIHWQIKKKDTKVVYRKLLKDSRYGYICFSKKRQWNPQKYPNQYKYQNFLVDNDYFDVEKVKSVKLVGREPTLDLRVEGEHNFIADGIVVHNTGNQRSSATPFGAATTTTPAGSKIGGKQKQRKDLTKIAVAHHIPYVATASVSHRADFITKVKKAVAVEGPAFINILAPCTLGWKFPEDMGIEIARLGVETNFWPLYEVEDGKYKLSYQPAKRIPIEEFIKPQGRFKHLKGDDKVMAKIQEHIDEQWDELSGLCSE
ncbi:MAG: thiamine pyrophosphate-dependent enzyme [Parcubacteria group bacterium]